MTVIDALLQAKEFYHVVPRQAQHVTSHTQLGWIMIAVGPQWQEAPDKFTTVDPYTIGLQAIDNCRIDDRDEWCFTIPAGECKGVQVRWVKCVITPQNPYFFSFWVTAPPEQQLVKFDLEEFIRDQLKLKLEDPYAQQSS